MGPWRALRRAQAMLPAQGSAKPAPGGAGWAGSRGAAPPATEPLPSASPWRIWGEGRAAEAARTAPAPTHYRLCSRRLCLGRGWRPFVGRVWRSREWTEAQGRRGGAAAETMEIAATPRAPSGGAPASRGSGAAPFGGAAAARAEFFEALRANFADAPAADVAARARGARFRGVTKHKRTQRYEVRALPMPAPPVTAAGRRPPRRPPPSVQISRSAENLACILNPPFHPPSSRHPPTAGAHLAGEEADLPRRL
jgi:hypothetical protein